MPFRPKKVSQRPAMLAELDPRGDVLADVLGVSLLRHALYKPIEARAPWGLRLGPRPRATFYLVARGTAWLEVDGEEPLRLAAGDAALLPHAAPHTLRDGPTTVPAMVCEGTRVGIRKIGGRGAITSLLAGFFELGPRPPVLLSGMPRLVPLVAENRDLDPWLAATLQLLLAETSAPGPASPLVLQRLADVLFVQALRSLTIRGRRTHPGLAALSDAPVHEALNAMHQRIAGAWTVASLAAHVGLSRSAFAARFTALVGEPPLLYLARWRMARAAELLRDTDHGLGEIAGRVGYESVPSFSNAFKKWQGARPGAFRRGQRQEARSLRGA
jgi:AraC-like DNA-binding protein/mannose-6-phosphate isomerase-like protein (cupin superfamily)